MNALRIQLARLASGMLASGMLASGITLSAMLGCGSGPYDLAPVSGVVTLDGAPVAEARVVFEPMRVGEEALNAGPGSWGQTDAEGRFVVETMAGERGAVVGLHRITITTFLGEMNRAGHSAGVVRQEEIPPRYFEAGALTFTVPADGTDAADFALTRSE